MADRDHNHAKRQPRQRGLCPAWRPPGPPRQRPEPRKRFCAYCGHPLHRPGKQSRRSVP